MYQNVHATQLILVKLRKDINKFKGKWKMAEFWSNRTQFNMSHTI